MERCAWNSRVRAATVVLVSGVAGACWAQDLPAAAEPDPAVRSYLSGNGLLSRGMYELAAKEYRDFLESHADHEKAPVARYGLGVALFRMKQYDEAAAELAKLRNLRGFAFGAEAALLLAQCDLLRSRDDEAATGLERLLKDYPDHDTADDAAALLAEARYRQGKFDLVAEPCRMIADNWPKSPHRDRAEFFWALADMARKDPAAAAARLTALLDRTPDSPLAEQSRLLAAQCLHQSGQLAEAAAMYKLVLDTPRTPYAADAYLGLGTLQRQRGKPDEAGDLLDRLVKTYPESELIGAALVERGRAWFDLERYDRAAAAFERAGQSGAGADQVAYWLAKCELRTDHAAAAAKRLRAALKANPESALRPEMMYDRAVALMRAGDLAGAAEALKEFGSALANHALAPDALEMLAGIEHSQEHYTESLALCQAFLKQFPAHPSAAAVEFLSAENMYLSGDLDAAARAYRQFLASHAGDASEAKAEFRLAMVLYRQEKYDEAKPLLERVARGRRTDPAFRSAVLCLGDLWFQRGKWAEAQPYLSDYVSFGPEAPSADDAALKLGLSHQRQGRPREAIAQYDALLEQFPQSQHRLQATLERGQSLMMLGKPDDAAAAFQAVIDADKDGRFAPFARAQLGAIAMGAGDYTAAAEQFGQAASAGGDDESRGESLFQRGQALMAGQRYADAAAAFGSLVDEQPSHPRADHARAQRAIAMARLKRDAAALAEIQSALARAGNLDSAVRDALAYERACCLRETGDKEAAAAGFRELLGRAGSGPLAPYATLDLAGLEADAGRFPVAAELLTKLRRTKDGPAALAPEIAEGATYRLAVCEYRMDHTKQAAALLDEFLSAHPKSKLTAAATVLAGECRFKLGQHKEAAAHFRRIVDEFPQEGASLGPSLLRLGESLAALQDWAASERVFTEYLDRFGDGELWFQARFGQGWARENAGRIDSAIEAYQQVVQKHQGATAARAQFQIGECLFAQDKLDEAVRELLKVDILYAYPEWSAAALYEAGRCLQAMSKPAEAAEQFKAVGARFPDTNWAKLAADQLRSLSSAVR